MFSIGECSRLTGLTIKALRLYHEKGLLVPHTVDEASGYRYYSAKNIEKARVIQQLCQMKFSLAQIKQILDQFEDDADLVEALRHQKDRLQSTVDQYSQIIKTLDVIIQSEQEAAMTQESAQYAVTEKSIDDQIIAGLKYIGKYEDCGQYFGQLCRKVGWNAAGAPFCMYYDSEYKEDGAEVEVCIPLKQEKAIEGLNVRVLPGGRCVSLLHKGPYTELKRSYEKIIAYIKEKEIAIQCPSRELYLKGPGMIFRGNPKNYLTEIQFMVEENPTESKDHACQSS